MTADLEPGMDEDVLGLGEQSSRLVKTGQKLVLRSEDPCGSGTGLAYKPVPVWHASAGDLGSSTWAPWLPRTSATCVHRCSA